MFFICLCFVFVCLFFFCLYFFFFNDTGTNEIYTLSLQDALPIYKNKEKTNGKEKKKTRDKKKKKKKEGNNGKERKKKRLKPRHEANPYAVFGLKKKKKNTARSKNKTNISVDTKLQKNKHA